MEVISSGEGRELTLTLRGELDHHAAKEASCVPSDARMMGKR